MDIGEGAVPPGVLGQNDSGQPSNLNISDVFEAISIADPSFGADIEAVVQGAMARPAPPHAGGPYVRITEQPASKALRFRYECEGRSAGSIPGVNSTADKKSYPTIEICGHTGKAIVVVSCVTREEPYKPHPHNLVGRDRCNRGVCTLKTEVGPDNTLVAFSNLGIQCVKRRDIGEALRVREELRVDPFKTGYGHKNQPQSIDLNAVRLCFQVFIPDEAGKIRLSLHPVVSDIVYDKKAMSDLQILRISRPSGYTQGGTEVILLCEKVTREDISVVLYEERREPGQPAVLWEESANIIVVHKQVAIAFTTPPYRNPQQPGHHEVFIQLKRISDNARSNSIPFTYIPDYQDSEYLKRKRQKTLTNSLLQQIEQDRSNWNPDQKPATIKSEPSEKASPLHMTSPMRYASPLDQVAEHTYQQWIPDMQGNINIAGPSPVSNPYYNQDMPWPGATYAQSVSPIMQNISPSMQPRSPNMHVMSPNIPVTSSNIHVMPSNMPVTSPNIHIVSPNIQVNMQAMSPNMQCVSPNMQAMSPNMQAMSPTMQAMSPTMQAMSPSMQAMSPNMQAVTPRLQTLSPHMQAMSPRMQAMSPHMQAMSPPGRVISPDIGQAMDADRQCGMGYVCNLGHVSPDLIQQPMAQQAMEAATNSNASLTNLLMDREEMMQPLQLNSGDLSNLSAILAEMHQ